MIRSLFNEHMFSALPPIAAASGSSLGFHSPNRGGRGPLTPTMIMPWQSRIESLTVELRVEQDLRTPGAAATPWSASARLHRPAPLGVALPGLATGPQRHGAGQTSNRGPVASQRLPALLAVAITPSGGDLPTVYQGLFSVAREGLKVVPVFNMAQATLRRRSAIDRKARPWL